MNKNLWLLALAQGFYLTNNITFIAINGLVGLSLAPMSWLATLPVMGYVLGSALSTTLVAQVQKRVGRQGSFQIALVISFMASLTCAYAATHQHFWLLNVGTLIAGFYNANAQLYRFAAAELAQKTAKEKAISWVLAGGLLGAVAGPNMANHTQFWFEQAFVGAYISLAIISIFGLLAISWIDFPKRAEQEIQAAGRPLAEIMRQPLFIICTATAALSYGVMNLLMAGTPLAMDICKLPFEKTAIVLEWHVIGMFAPGFFTGNLIQRFGILLIMRLGVVIYAIAIAIALSGETFSHFLIALFLLGVGWNFLFTSSTTLALKAYRPEERDKAQGAINFFVFSFTAVSSFSSGLLITSQGWYMLGWGSIAPLILIMLALVWLSSKKEWTLSA